MAAISQTLRVGALRVSVALGLSSISIAAMANGVFPGPFENPAPGTYYFSGNCLDCPPVPSPAGAVLVMGASVQSSSLTYLSSLNNLQSSAFEYIWGDLSQPGPNNFKTLFGDANGQWWVFETLSNGAWNLAKDGIGSADFGDQGLWNTRPVPEPATYGLFGLGLGLVALARRRKTDAAGRA